MKYYIIPKSHEAMDEIEADNAFNALMDFAFTMDSNMETYFKAITEEEYREYIRNYRYEMHKQFVTDWMIDTLQSDFDLKDKYAREYGERAYDIYSSGNGGTEYESVEAAYDEYIEEHPEEEG